MHFVPFTAVTRMSGVDFDGNEIRKGAADAMQSYVTHAGGMYSPDCDRVVKSIASKGGTPLVVAKNHKILGVIYLKDIIKQGVKEKFADRAENGHQDHYDHRRQSDYCFGHCCRGRCG